MTVPRSVAARWRRQFYGRRVQGSEKKKKPMIDIFGFAMNWVARILVNTASAGPNRLFPRAEDPVKISLRRQYQAELDPAGIL